MSLPPPQTPWSRYLQLMEERPEDFPAGALLPIETDPVQAAAFTARTGRALGVLYESPYRMLLVEPVRGPEGLFAYERLLPASRGPAVVAVPVWEGRFVLLKQFRHALRRCQVGFPRGFGEDGLTAEENVRKEIREELDAGVLEQRLLGRVEPDSGLTGESVSIFLCRITEPRRKRLYEGILDLLLLTPAELEGEIAAGRVSDGFTLSAWALLRAAGPDRLENFPGNGAE